MTSHPAPLAFGNAGISLAFGQYRCPMFDEMPEGAQRDNQPHHGNGLALDAVARNRLHRECRAPKGFALNAGIREKSINGNFLHCEGLVEGRVSFFGHISLPLRLYDRIVAREAVKVPQVNFMGLVAARREYFPFARTAYYFRLRFARCIGSTITAKTTTPIPNKAANSHHSQDIQFVLRAVTNSARAA